MPLGSEQVLVTHPHAAAVSIGVAAALQRERMLAMYVGGVVSGDSGPSRLFIEAAARLRPELNNRIAHGVPSNRVRSLSLVELGARLAARLNGARPYDQIFLAHDRVTAALPWPSQVRAVYAYEDGAQRTFERARRRGMVTIYDLPIPHHRTMDEVVSREVESWKDALSTAYRSEPEWKLVRKDRELELADLVCVASRFTKDSLERAGCRRPIHVCPYGFPIESFPMKESSPRGPFTVLAVGTQDLRKGTVYLLEAWRRAKIKGGRLRLIGGSRLAPGFLRSYSEIFEHVPHVPKAHIGAEYRNADLLAFPTLCDGFGLVIQEAMCSGTPVVTTPSGGGPECITDGEDGFIVPARDVDALVERMRWAASERDRLADVGRRARSRAERHPWSVAGELYARAVKGALRGE